ncbi:COG4705 family protein [Sphingobium nicotianae]|uniref:Membrane-anchored protein n=1 Tax=Sphingobium nicotianae TaxID=2782607 RepID=A0A9X1DFV2_9SPHN|nr:hypothetical protein [Sphingobium nicotianae]MBT2189230.1 hypothetical protein [Sphingobium nicotianae]
MQAETRATLSKVPAITLGFWLIKILATTLGETAGDTLSMTMNLGYLASTAIFALLLLVLVWRQVAATAYRPYLYWATIIASTTAGTTMADFATRSLGIGYAGGSALLLAAVLLSLASWRLTLGSISAAHVADARTEIFYWVTITFSQTLGTALGDWTADSAGMGYGGAAILFASGLALLLTAYWLTSISRIALFWAAFILTRPLGAAVGDFLDKPLDHGGLAFSRPLASAVLGAAILALVVLSRWRADDYSREI